MPAGSLEKTTSTSPRSAMARSVAAVDCLNLSIGDCASLMRDLSGGLHPHARSRKLRAEAALVILRDDRPFGIVALVEEGHAEGETDILEYVGVLGPGEDRSRRHHGGNVADDEACPTDRKSTRLNSSH